MGKGVMVARYRSPAGCDSLNYSRHRWSALRDSNPHLGRSWHTD